MNANAPFKLPKNKTPLHQMAFWAAILCAILLMPQTWVFSGWLSNKLLAPEFGFQIAYYMRPIVCLCLFMAGLAAARATLSSSLALVALAALTKLPL